MTCRHYVFDFHYNVWLVDSYVFESHLTYDFSTITFSIFITAYDLSTVTFSIFFPMYDLSTATFSIYITAYDLSTVTFSIFFLSNVFRQLRY